MLKNIMGVNQRPPAELDVFFNGDQLYGDDFGPEEILAWVEDEKEGYANLGAGDAD